MQGLAQFLFELSPDAAVYQSTASIGSGGRDLFFWKYYNSFKSNGPFYSALEASRHYETLVASLRAAPEPNIIRVDFLTRKRL